MIDDHIKIADDLLAYLEQNRGFSTLDGYPSYLQEKLHLEQDIWVVKNFLKEQKLIDESEDETKLRITFEGTKVAQTGYRVYCDNYNKKQREKDARDHRDAVMSKWQIIIFWPMFVFATIGTSSGIISLIILIAKSMK